MEEKKDNSLIEPPKQVVSAVEQLFQEEVSKTKNVDDAVELLVTHESLANEETRQKLVEEKGKEQENKYEAKRIQAEAEKIKQEKEKQLAELDKVISAKQKEVEKLKADSDKAQTFFDNNEDILSCIGIRSKKTLGVMYALMIPATIIFILIRIIALPLTIGGKLVEILIEIISGICKAITNNALKIIISILVILLLAGGGFCAYYFGGKLIL